MNTYHHQTSLSTQLQYEDLSCVYSKKTLSVLPNALFVVLAHTNTASGIMATLAEKANADMYEQSVWHEGCYQHDIVSM